MSIPTQHIWDKHVYKIQHDFSIPLPGNTQLTLGTCLPITEQLA